MQFAKLLLLSTILLSGATFAEQSLNVEVVTPNGLTFKTGQILGEEFAEGRSNQISKKISPTGYQAIRCGGPWGAVKYRVMLSNGPGLKINNSKDHIVIQVIEYSVISKDQAIATMGIQCVDTEPTQIFRSIEEIKLIKNIEKQEKINLSNGYTVKYHYTPQ
ncbi:hypothetical protein [Microbulbifer sp. GL-2]|uniref:hypothetical protein n=1 Tax=Microbulbifer sp. GL-2 TaxID=2591606 RepID=UPI0011628F4C|nr:hypothetical protein [Microbulbifer sp. GL-2]BBM00618.1 hypothetical protein GL2_06920 [Microbulbifer sp. GL-2]